MKSSTFLKCLIVVMMFDGMGGAVSRPACGLALGDAVPSGFRDALPVYASGGGCLAKRMEFFNCFALGRGKRGERIFLVGIASDSGGLGDDLLTDDFNRKVESVGMTIGTRSHCLRDGGESGGTFHGDCNLAGGCGLLGGGGGCHVMRSLAATKER